MSIPALIVAGIALLIAAGLLWWRRSVGRELAVMAETPTTEARKVRLLRPGQAVEVKGVLRCAEPLAAEFSGRPCAWHLSVVEREYESSSTDSRGERTTNRQRETVHRNERRAAVEVEDPSGRVSLDLTGAKIEGIDVHSRFERNLSLSGIVGDLLNVNNTTLGFHYRETILEPDQPVYVLGAVTAGGGVGVSAEKGRPFVVSHKSEEQRDASLSSTRAWLLGIAIVLIVVGVGALGYAVATRPHAVAPAAGQP